MDRDDRQGASGPEPYQPGATGAGRTTLDHLYSLAYEELRRLARSVRRGDPSATLSPTTLVNEAWIKLAASPRWAHTSPLHFRRIAARAMRQVLIEAARRRTAGKRDGQRAAVQLDEMLIEGAPCDKELLALEDALQELSRLHPRQAAMVECRFFGGLEVAEIARVLEISEATVLRDWRAAKAWLALEMRRAT